MAARPNLNEMRSQSQASNNSMSSRPLRSPRIHMAGEVPPELSPLDAFALQSRILAMQLEESAKGGKRMSRLPPLTTESPLIVQGRSDYFRSMSQDSHSDHSNSPAQGLQVDVEDHLGIRPVSMHPRLSQMPPPVDESQPLPVRPLQDAPRGRSNPADDARGLFGARREQSPTPLNLTASPTKSLEYCPSFNQSPSKLVKQNSFDAMALAPPRPLFSQRSSSVLSSPLESTDESSFGGTNSLHSQPVRTLSSSSSGQAFSPGIYQRSPSIASEASAALPRPSFNFSRPLSRAGTPNLDTPSRQASSDSHPSFVLADDTANTPVSMTSEGFPESQPDEAPTGSSTYIYSKFSLPRGKILQRSSPLFPESLPQMSFLWEPPSTAPPSNIQRIPQAPPSPPTRPSSSSGPLSLSFEKPLAGFSLAQQPSPNPSRPSTEDGRLLASPPFMAASKEPTRGRTPLSISTSDSASTVRPPRSQYSFAPSALDMSAEEHVTKAIDCHENGSLSESTYHLRHAARQNHPTGMLLYALACRHGWGMRPNQREGVEWLRKAAQCTSLEMAEEDDQVKDGKQVETAEQKTRKAQFALSIYELGVSAMNGWGIDQDRALALRCFEIAGSWGDVDALAEAGFCYAQGLGCKKDLKKSAWLYRMAEAKGMSMVGNSWIHKSKYNDGNDTKKAGKEKKSRSKSRTRNLFGLKSSS